MSTKVLVFESDADFAGELRNELGKLGCSTCVVDDGSVGLQQASAEKPDLILLSIELPRMNGFSVCNKLKKDPSLKDVPLIIMSSESSDETFEQHRKLRTRAEDYVHKPIAFGELLRHIRTFVPMEAPAEELGDTDGIVIDEEISIQSEEMEDDEGTQIAVRPDLVAQKPRGVDAEVDAFTDAAFGRLQDAPHSGEAVPTNGARTRAAPSTRPGAPLAVKSARQSVRAQASNEADLERLRGEAERAQANAARLEKELTAANEKITHLHEDADAEAERAQRELEELRTRLQQASKGGGVISSREFLDLREALNKKDKEILALKESVGKKDREIFEAHDRALGFERAQSESDDRILAKERELADAREKADELTSQLDDAKRSSEDLKTKFGKAQGEAETRSRELADLHRQREEENATHDATLASLKADHAKAVASLEQARDDAVERAEVKRRSELEEADSRNKAAIEQADALHRAALEDAESKSRAERARAREEHEAAAEAAHAAAQVALTEALGAREKDLRGESDAKLAALHRAQQDELGRAKNDFNQQLDAAKRNAEERLAAQQAELQQQLAEAVAAVEARAAAQLADARAVAAAEKAASSDHISGLERELGDMSTRRADLEEAKRASDAANESKITDLSDRLSQATAARDALEKGLAEARDRIATLEVDLSAVRGDLQDTKMRLELENRRLEKAVSKWDADRGTLERAKDALAVALAQIDEIEGRQISD